MTTPVPPAAITAALNRASELGYSAITTKSVTALLEAAAAALRAEGAAAERDRRREQVIGYKIGGKLYHPADVTIVLRGEP